MCNQETEISSEKGMHPSFSWVKERKSEIFYGSIIVCSFFRQVENSCFNQDLIFRKMFKKWKKKKIYHIPVHFSFVIEEKICDHFFRVAYLDNKVSLEKKEMKDMRDKMMIMNDA